jgi:hypothetical protein
VERHHPKTGICEQCGKLGDTDYAKIEGREYTRNREDYQELCRKCHVNYDGIGGSRWKKQKLLGESASQNDA